MLRYVKTTDSDKIAKHILIGFFYFNTCLDIIFFIENNTLMKHELVKNVFYVYLRNNLIQIINFQKNVMRYDMITV